MKKITRGYTTLGTSVIYSSMSPPFLHIKEKSICCLAFNEWLFQKVYYLYRYNRDKKIDDKLMYIPNDDIQILYNIINCLKD